MRNYRRDGRQFLIVSPHFALTRWFMKASLPEVSQRTGKCFQMVCIVTKNNFSAIKIFERYDWKTPSLSDYFLLSYYTR